ncbi:MAG: ATP-binding protein [Oscillospiraceae bacterium]|nr:ATP-binding protein [Oscillospiraceae bacterium]
MKKRLFIYTTAVVFIGLISFFALSVYITSTNNINAAKDTVVEVTQICAALYNEEIDIEEFVHIGSDTRITVIDADGTVLADSGVSRFGMATIDSHLERPEIKAALNGAPESFMRRSDTLGLDFIYYALKVDSGDSYVFVRAAIPVASINTYFLRSLPLLMFVLVIVAVLCFVIIRRITDYTLAPFGEIERKLRSLSQGNYIAAPIKSRYEEINRIVQEIEDIALELGNEKRRREDFFTYASHELKTPLTAIKGFNELIELSNTNSVVKDEKTRKFASAISRETERMTVLVDEMLKLSEIENTEKTTAISNSVPVPLTALIYDIRDTMTTIIGEKSISFLVVGNGVVTADPRHVYDVVKNLVENAVRYTGEDGEVTVTITQTDDSTKLSVADNGIGIPKTDQLHVFERFYRVEKSRTRNSIGGGTGLGLAIVKHLCVLNDWRVSMVSEPGVGTEVTIEF